MVVKSYVNQVDRVFINSSDDVTTPYNGYFNTFQAIFQTPILDAERCQLLRATIPTPMPNLPDYSLQFVYCKRASLTDPIADNLKCVRILPYGYKPDSGTYAINRYLSSYQDFVDLLNTASANDDVGINPYFEANDIVFALDTETNTINITGADNTKYYSVIGYNDPLFQTVYNAIQLPTGTPVNPNFVGSYVAGYPLNLRVGFAQPQKFEDSVANSNNSANSMVPVLGDVPIVADSYPNLVRSQCVYLYSNIAVASAMGSNGKHNLLTVVPVNSPQLGVSNYTALTINFLTKIAQDSINNISITMLDDADQPYWLPDNANVNVEIAFKYSD